MIPCWTGPWFCTAQIWAMRTHTRQSTCRRSLRVVASGMRATLRSTVSKTIPLPNLFVSMLQRIGIETDRFASSTGAMSGLEMTKA